MASLGSHLAALNATLNGLSAVFLMIGFVAIRNNKIPIHRFCMMTAFFLSTVFLISYLTRFYLTGVHRFSGSGPLKGFYLSLLGTHTVLAAVTPFLAIRAIYLALQSRIDEHKKVTRFAFPIWMYVSVTGVIVYWMLYHLNSS